VVDDVRTPTATGSFGTLLQPLTEENETTEAVVDNGAVMAATMTDIQAAIDQLGQQRNDDARSMSFASTRDDRGSELGHDLDDEDLDGEDWHRDARRRLFEGLNAVDGRHATPPVDVEMSDESDVDDAHPHLHHNHDARSASSKKTHTTKEQPKSTQEELHRSPSPLPTSDHSSPARQPSTLEGAPKADVPPSSAPELAHAEIDLRSPSKSPASPAHSKEPSQTAPIPVQSNTQLTTPNTVTPSALPLPDSLSVPSISRTPVLPSATTLNPSHTAPTRLQSSPIIPESNYSGIYPLSQRLIRSPPLPAAPPLPARPECLLCPPSEHPTPRNGPSSKWSNGLAIEGSMRVFAQSSKVRSFCPFHFPL
jgi:hypothetical protein